MSLFKELKRRNVFRVGIAYAVASWLLIEASTVLLEAFEAPMWIPRALLILLSLGFPIVLVFAWALEITPEGIRKQSDIDESAGAGHFTAKRLDIVTIVLLVVAVAFVVFDRLVLKDRVTAPQVASTTEIGTMDRPERTAQEKSVAVLPFTDRSAEPDPNRFVDGIHDDLLTQLAKIAALKVISRTSVMEYRDTTKNLRTIGEELGASTIMEGAVQRVGNRVRINAQLIDADTDEHLWAETYDRELTAANVFDMQTEIARSIADALQAALSPAEETRLEKRLTDNLEAMAAYQRALRMDDIDRAASLYLIESELQHALELDPEFAAAWAMLARTRLGEWWWGARQDGSPRDDAWEYIQRGRDIDPNLPELDIAEGYYHYWGYRDYARALEVLTPVLEARPNDAELHQVLAFVNRRGGNPDAVLGYLHRAFELDPRSVAGTYALGETYAWARDFERAEPWLEKLEELGPTTPSAYQLRGRLLGSGRGDYSAAARLLNVAAQNEPWMQTLEWEYLVHDGQFDQALERSEFPEESWLTEFSSNHPAFRRGLIHTYAGDPESARTELETGLAWIDARLAELPEHSGALQARCAMLGALGRKEETAVACELALEHRIDDEYDRPYHERRVAEALALAGLEEEALDLVETILEFPAGPTVHDFQTHPAFRDLRETERWQQLMTEYGTAD